MKSEYSVGRSVVNLKSVVVECSVVKSEYSVGHSVVKSKYSVECSVVKSEG